MPGCAGPLRASASYRALPVDQSGTRYRAVCSAPGAESVISDAAALTVTALPVLLVTDPSSQSVTAGQPVSFTVACAKDSGPDLTVAWELSTDRGLTWEPIDGATSAAYGIDAADLSQDGSRYRAVCSNGTQTATSRSAILTVTAAPTTPPSEAPTGSPTGGTTETPTTGPNQPAGTLAPPAPTPASGTTAGANLASTGADTDRTLPFGLALLAAGAAMAAAGRTRLRSRHQ